MAAFICTCCVFGLLALFPIFGLAGYAVFGPAGAVFGVAAVMFLMVWAGCYFMEN